MRTETWIGDERVGGRDGLREHLGMEGEDEVTCVPVVAIFAVAFLMAAAATWATLGTVFAARTFEWFVAFGMCVLAIRKLRDIESFTSMFLGYDLLARRVVRYACFYPFAEAVAGVLMIAGALLWIGIPLALFIGTVGAVSVFKAVHVDKRELECACVGGSSNVPLGFVSLTENVMMVVMALWMLVK